ncbi:MAG: hypothetical protein AAB536_02360, partial [Patescibacteria group bacterium]
MLDFITSIIKAAVAIIAGGIIAIGGIFSHKQAEVQVLETPATQEIVQQTEPSSTENISVPGGTNPAATATKPIATKPKPTSQSVTATTTPPIAVQPPTPQPVQEINPLPPQIEIDPETFVGILCYFNASIINPLDGSNIGGGEISVRGSGVIVNSKGYILTNRHVIVRDESNVSIGDLAIPGILKYKFEHCDVGQLPKGTHLPTVSEIRAINPLTRIPVLGYTAEPVYDSSVLPLSGLETGYADFAILKITGVSQDGPSFGINSVPASFPHAKLLP